MIKKLTKGIEDSKKERDRLSSENERLREMFKEIEQKAFKVQEKYKETQKVVTLLPLSPQSDGLERIFIVVCNFFPFLFLYVFVS